MKLDEMREIKTAWAKKHDEGWTFYGSLTDGKLWMYDDRTDYLKVSDGGRVLVTDEVLYAVMDSVTLWGNDDKQRHTYRLVLGSRFGDKEFEIKADRRKDVLPIAYDVVMTLDEPGFFFDLADSDLESAPHQFVDKYGRTIAPVEIRSLKEV